MNDLLVGVKAAMQDAEIKAWEALSGYKFWMFGYHAGRWINYNNLMPLGERRANPFSEAVKLARRKRDEIDGQRESILNDLKEKNYESKA